MLKKFAKLFLSRHQASLKKRRSRRTWLSVERMEDRVTPSWGAIPPAVIAPPVGATLVTLNGFGQGSGSADISANEIDWYKLSAPATGSYQIRTDNSASGVDTVLGVFNVYGTRLGYNDDISFPSNTDSRVTSSLTLSNFRVFGGGTRCVAASAIAARAHERMACI